MTHKNNSRCRRFASTKK